MTKDLVCGMEIDESAARYPAVFEDAAYFVCSEGCRAEFKRRPEEYLKPVDACCHKTPQEEKSDV